MAAAFGAGVTEIPGDGFAAVGKRAPDDSGAAEIPDGEVPLGVGVVAAGADGASTAPTKASAMPLIANAATQMANPRLALPILNRGIVFSRDKFATATFVGRRQFQFTVLRPIFASLGLSMVWRNRQAEPNRGPAMTARG